MIIRRLSRKRDGNNCWPAQYITSFIITDHHCIPSLCMAYSVQTLTAGPLLAWCWPRITCCFNTSEETQSELVKVVDLFQDYLATAIKMSQYWLGRLVGWLADWLCCLPACLPASPVCLPACLRRLPACLPAFLPQKLFSHLPFKLVSASSSICTKWLIEKYSKLYVHNYQIQSKTNVITYWNN